MIYFVQITHSQSEGFLFFTTEYVGQIRHNWDVAPFSRTGSPARSTKDKFSCGTGRKACS